MNETETDKPKGEDGLNTIISSLLSGDNASKLIAVLILVTSGGNFFATQRATSIKEEDVNRAIKEVHALHDAISESLDRQKTMLDIMKKLEPPK